MPTTWEQRRWSGTGGTARPMWPLSSEGGSVATVELGRAFRWRMSTWAPPKGFHSETSGGDVVMSTEHPPRTARG